MTAMCRWSGWRNAAPDEGDRLDLRQPHPVRAVGGFRFLPAHLEGRCRQARRRECRPDLESGRQDHVSGRLCHPDRAEGPGHRGLEDRFRPHFFGGVATVVGKLFTQCRPDFAIFGEKDFQQLRVVTRMAGDLDLGVKVIGSRTVRERDGLAMSSRNVYLSPERAPHRAGAVPRHEGKRRRLRAGDDIEAAMAGGAEMITDAGFALDYFEVRHAETLAPITSVKDGPMRILVAAKTRKDPADRQYRGSKAARDRAVRGATARASRQRRRRRL